MSADELHAEAAQTGDMRRYARLLRYLRPHLGWFLLAVVGFLLAAGGEAYFARLLGDIVDAFESPAAHHVWLFPALMLAAAAVRAVGAVVGDFLMSRISFRIVHVIRHELFARLVTLPSAFFDRSAQGALVSRLTYNTAQLRDTVTDAVKIVIQDGGKVIVLLAFMLYANWLLTLIFLAVAPVVGSIVRYASRRFRRISRRIQRSMGDVTQIASETVSGYRVMRTFGGEPYERDRFVAASERNRRQNLKMAATKAVSTQTIQLLVAVALALLVGFLFQPDLATGMSAGDLIAYLGYAGLLANPIKKLSEVNARLQRGLAAAEDVFWQLDQTPEADTGERTVERAEGRIEFRNVSFRYEEAGRDALEGVSFTLEPGETVALVGRSGAGKSTLASLIARFYDATDGTILLDGAPVEDYTLASLRAQIALVTQDVTLFNDTLRRNIAYGRLARASDDEIDRAVHGAHVDQFVDDLSAGLDTVLGDDGVLLSGGQRQRVAIARALLKDAPILILDEATSALDPESERHIRDALDAAMRGRTTLVIAHRLSTIENADRIVVLAEGRVAEIGRHAELIAAGGAYAQLYRSQFANGDEAEPPAPPAAPGPAVREPTVPPRTALERSWYGRRWWTMLLRPLATLFAAVVGYRRRRFRAGRAATWRAPVPVVVVGNVTVGGTGKSPLVIWLANWLRAQGASPGVVLRGYRRRRRPRVRYPLLVTAGTAASRAGDEAVMIARATGAPVVVAPDRVAAVRHLLDRTSCDVVLCDDGLQHYALERDLEIAVLDGDRGVGNGCCLPAGPLREPVSRLADVDLVIANGAATGLAAPEHTMAVRPVAFRNLASGATVAPRRFAEDVTNAAGGAVYAVSAIGNPARFHRTLAELGLAPVERSFPDHHAFVEADFAVPEAVPEGACVVMTEKDAARIAELPNVSDGWWALEVAMEPDADFQAAVAEALRSRGVDV